MLEVIIASLGYAGGIVSDKFILIPCRYTPKKDIWFSCELPMEEAVCGTN